MTKLGLAEEPFDVKLSRYLRLTGYRTTGTGRDAWTPGGRLYLLKDQPPLLRLSFITIPAPRLCLGRFSWDETDPKSMTLDVYGQDNFNSLSVLGYKVQQNLKVNVQAYLEKPTPQLELFGFIW